MTARRTGGASCGRVAGRCICCICMARRAAWLLFAASGGLTLALAALIGVPLLLVATLAGHSNGAGVCQPALPSPTVGVASSASQQQNARLIDQVAVRRGLPGQATLVALMASLTESNLLNVNYGDRDSLGLFQERPSSGWGLPQQLLDPQYATEAFFGGAAPPGNPGLVDVDGWPQLSLGAAAQQVERSAFSDRYATNEAAIRVIAAQAGIDLTRAGDPYAGRAGGPPNSPPGGVEQVNTNPPVGCIPAPAGSMAGQQVIAAVERWLNTPYSWGGGNPSGPTLGTDSGAGTVGFDFSGLTQYAYAQLGIALPHNAAAQSMMGTRIPRSAGLDVLHPGDLVFFALDPISGAGIHHVGIYLGGGKMVDAPHTGTTVRIEPVWTDSYAGASQWP